MNLKWNFAELGVINKENLLLETYMFMYQSALDTVM